MQEKARGDSAEEWLLRAPVEMEFISIPTLIHLQLDDNSTVLGNALPGHRGQEPYEI